ncbi:MAG: hydantoinase/oxoprolinase family protein [Acetobacteraceae bacterium]
MRVGVEVGGTFTDLVAVDTAGVRVVKVPSTPHSPEEGVFAALAAAGISLDAVDDLVHGSTIATNAVLERKGGLTALVTTIGFRDILLLRRGDRPQIYQLIYRKPQPIVERQHSFEVNERVLANGSVHVPLDLAATEQMLREALAGAPFQAVAVCLLNAYINPAHERAIAVLIRKHFPALHVTCSHEVAQEFREYERASTTALSAYVQPVMDRYLGRFDDRLRAEGFKGRFSIMQSNGGRLPASAIRRNAITALFSGPAAGVAGAVRQGVLAGRRNIITFDMGGTSTDVSLITDAEPGIAAETTVDGLPVRTPVIDISSVGAGGGSIVWRDAGGLLRSGPQSAGAMPGPACYGRGGREPTITDAHLIRGTIPPDSLLGGHMPLDLDAARAAFGPLAAEFGMSLEQIADSAIRVANANVVRAIQLISTETGHDPRDYVLMPFGGAGPLHAGSIAEDLGIPTIVVPPNAGVLSAYGLLAADFTQFAAVTRKIPLDANAPSAVRETFADMAAKAVEQFRASGITAPPTLGCTLNMRFVGQAFELDVPLSSADLDAMTETSLFDAFERRHQQVYFHSAGSGIAGKKVEVVGLRLRASAPEPAFDLPVRHLTNQAPLSERQVFIDGALRTCTIVPCDHVRLEAGLSGPALIADITSTIYIPPAWQAQMDRNGSLIVHRKEV